MSRSAQTGARGPLPNFLIIGSGKSGTTSLFRYLCQHPDVCGSSEKEPDYLAWGEGPDPSPAWAAVPGAIPARTLAEYRGLFAHWSGQRAIGEASTSSIDSPRAPGRARGLVPGARLVAILRQPVDRAFSQFLHNRQDGEEPLDDFRSAWSLGIVPGHVRGTYRRAYRERSRYAGFLEAWLRHFSRDGLHVILYEDFAADPAGAVRRVGSFLGIDPGFVPDVSIRFNTSGRARHRVIAWALARFRRQRRFLADRLSPRVFSAAGRALRKPEKLDPELRGRLTAEMRGEILALQDLLGRDLGPWLK